MIDSSPLNGKLALDPKGIDGLRQTSRQNSPEALKAATKQFEALFTNMMLKGMREATPQDGLFDSEQTKLYTSMLDQEISKNMASRGIGLADMLYQQLSKMTSPGAQGGAESGNVALPPSTTGQTPDVSAKGSSIKVHPSRPHHLKAFAERLAPHAEQASRDTGIPAKFMLGQAALESGWGKREIVGKDGTQSHNLFGIKATKGWKGKVVEAVTTEYVHGVPHTKREKFRAYDSYADAFRDYAKLLRNNPRYENVLASAQDAVGFAQGLQKAGYATDPHYAAKLTNIIKKSLSA